MRMSRLGGVDSSLDLIILPLASTMHTLHLIDPNIALPFPIPVVYPIVIGHTAQIWKRQRLQMAL
jgi:hypothetical protein